MNSETEKTIRRAARLFIFGFYFSLFTGGFAVTFTLPHGWNAAAFVTTLLIAFLLTNTVHKAKNNKNIQLITSNKSKNQTNQ